jgi:hypothetical protein
VVILELIHAKAPDRPSEGLYLLDKKPSPGDRVFGDS